VAEDGKRAAGVAARSLERFGRSTLALLAVGVLSWLLTLYLGWKSLGGLAQL